MWSTWLGVLHVSCNVAYRQGFFVAGRAGTTYCQIKQTML